MHLLALSMLFPNFGIEPNSHYAIGTINTFLSGLLCIYNADNMTWTYTPTYSGYWLFSKQFPYLLGLYLQITACDGMHIRKCAWLDSTTFGERKNVPFQGNRHGRFELQLSLNIRNCVTNFYATCRSDFFAAVSRNCVAHAWSPRKIQDCSLVTHRESVT